MRSSYLKPGPNDTIGGITVKLVRYALLAIAVALCAYAVVSLLFGVLPEAAQLPRAIAAITLGSVIGYGLLIMRKSDGKNESGMLEPEE